MIIYKPRSGKELANAIKAYRRARGYSLRQFAEKTLRGKCSHQVVWKWERCESSPDMDMIIHMIRCGMPAGALLEPVEVPDKEVDHDTETVDTAGRAAGMGTARVAGARAAG